MLRVYRCDNYEVAGRSLSRDDADSFAANLGRQHSLFRPPPDNLVLDLEGMLHCFRQFTQDLGVRVSYRFPSEYNFVTVLPRNNILRVGREYKHYSLRLNGFTRGPLIYLKEQRSAARLVSVLNHELTHFLGYTRYELSASRTPRAATLRDVVKKQSGYASRLFHRHLFNRFNEGLTEITNQQIQREYWSTHPRLQKYLGSKRSSYRLCIAFEKALFESLARDSGKSPGEIIRRFQRGYFNGNRRVLDLMRKHYGEESFSFVARLPRDESEFVRGLQKTNLWDVLR